MQPNHQFPKKSKLVFVFRQIFGLHPDPQHGVIERSNQRYDLRGVLHSWHDHHCIPPACQLHSFVDIRRRFFPLPRIVPDSKTLQEGTTLLHPMFNPNLHSVNSFHRHLITSTTTKALNDFVKREEQV